jgi:osmotically-inducible protein OsmY
MLRETERSELLQLQKVTEVAKSRLKASPYLPLAKVTCEYEDGVLLLQGRLPDFYHKQLAQHAVAEIPGVTQVVNDTKVAAIVA